MSIAEYHAYGNLLVTIPVDLTLGAHSEDEMRIMIVNMLLQMSKGVLVEDQIDIKKIRELIK
jgi:hypothetical protein